MTIRRAHFHVTGETFNKAREATVTITENDRAGLFSVRPKRSRDVYELTLAEVAVLVLQRIDKLKRQSDYAALHRARSHR